MTQADSHPPTPFTLDGFGALLDAFRDVGYRVRGYRDADPERADLVLRHDVDLCLDRAATLGALEARRGLRAYYFVLVTSEFYNVFSPRGRTALAALGEQGHEIGLHFDAAAYAVREQEELVPHIERECSILEQAVGQAVDVVTYHRPGPSGVDRLTAPFAGRVNVHEPRIYRDIAWCADSNGEWREGPPTTLPAFRRRRAIQLITHPVWWVGATPADRESRLEHFVAARTAFLHEELARNCKAYRPLLVPVPPTPDPERPL